MNKKVSSNKNGGNYGLSTLTVSHFSVFILCKRNQTFVKQSSQEPKKKKKRILFTKKN